MSSPARLRLPPDDEFNRTLVDHTHPSDWQNPEPADRYNVVVIGAGTAGLVTAAGAAGLGARVALIEKHLMGGDCLNVGCVPSKAMIRSARAVATVERAAELGVRWPTDAAPEADFEAVMARMRRLRATISPHDSAARFRDLGVDVFLGTGRFTGRDTIAVGDQTLRFKRAVIATGGRPAVPPVDGLEDAGYLTNHTVFELTRRPDRFAVLGGGPIGIELAQTMRRLGAKVTVIELGPRIMSNDDPDAAGIVAGTLRREGVDLRLETSLERVTLEDGRRVLHVTDADGETDRIAVDALLVATGRRPNTEDLGLDAAGVDVDERGGLVVDDRLRTTNKRVYAAGDVGYRYQFTHAADATARLVIANALFFGRSKASALTIPWATYSDPEVAHVGLTAEAASERGLAIDTYEEALHDVDRALLDAQTEGFIRVHTKRGKDEIVGATIVAAHAGDLIGYFSLAMTQDIGLGDIAKTVFPYPTQSEMVKRIADQYNRTRLKPWIKRLFERWFAWWR